MDPFEVLTGLFRLGGFWTHLRQRFARAAHRLLVLNIMLAAGLITSVIALVLLIFGVERELAHRIGEVAAPLVMAAVLGLIAVALIMRTLNSFRRPMLPPAPQQQGATEEFSAGAGLALVAGIVVGILLQNRKDKE